LSSPPIYNPHDRRPALPFRKAKIGLRSEGMAGCGDPALQGYEKGPPRLSVSRFPNFPLLRLSWFHLLPLFLMIASLLPRLVAADPVVSDQGATGLPTREVKETDQPTVQETRATNERPATLFIREYRVEGARKLPRVEVEKAVYPFLGPGRTRDDVDQARAALEGAYHDAGFQTVAVRIPPQQGEHGVVRLLVVEIPVGRLRVKGARYSSPEKIKAMAPSVAEGNVVDFNAVPKDIVALNQLPDRQVTPSLRAGVQPDTVDVDLEVKEKLPLHASVELNNRNGPDTEPLRFNATVSASNLGQSGNALGFSFQESPQQPSQVRVFSAYYLERFRNLEWLSLMLQGTKQNSNVSTLGDTAVVGRGQTLGLRAIFNLPSDQGFSHSVSAGLDYKHFNQTVNLGGTNGTGVNTIVTPITYYPLGANYTATWQGKRSSTEVNAGVTFHLQSGSAQFNNNRYNADGNFIYFRGDLSHTHELPAGFQIFGKLQGQIADQPLLNSEQISGGGLGTVRGYLEAEEVGDNGLFGSLELRSPPLPGLTGTKKGEWRLFVFADAGWLTIIDPLPDQKNHFDLSSYGVGSRLRLLDHFDGSVSASRPQISQGQTKAQDTRVTFRAGLDY
jgi:hemolysin activation/secretion protein